MRCCGIGTFGIACASLLVLGCGSALKVDGTFDGSTDSTDERADGTVGCTSDGECDDGDPCNGSETCGSDGTCEPGTPLADGSECEEDGVPGTCSDGECVPETCGDGHLDAGEECDDGNDAPDDGCEATCTYSCHEDGECDDGNVCTDDVCAEGGTGRICTFENNTAACDDGNPCTDGDTCADGACGPGTNICECEATEDCAEHEDGDLCNGTLVCDTDTNTCVVDPETVVTCSPTSTLCHVLVCVPETGLCVDDNPAAGTACEDDSNACTDDECDGAGACVHSTVTCSDGNVCTDDSCDPSSGCVFTDNTSPCDDGNACTAGDTCSGGSCTPGMGIACSDRNDCTDDSCDPSSGCVFTPHTRSCDDGDPCTTGDVCDGAGSCVGTGIPVWYRDADADGYGDPGDHVCSSTAPSGYVDNDEDCCDSDDRVNPAHTTFLYFSYTCGSDPPSFDWNCDGVEEWQHTVMGSCTTATDGTCVTTQGWTTSPIPGCGVAGTWLGACVSGGPGTACSPGATTTRTQTCR